VVLELRVGQGQIVPPSFRAVAATITQLVSHHGKRELRQPLRLTPGKVQVVRID